MNILNHLFKLLKTNVNIWLYKELQGLDIVHPKHLKDILDKIATKDYMFGNRFKRWKY